MSRAWPMWARVVIAALAVVLLYWPFANYFWTSQQIAGPSAATGGNPVTISAPVNPLTDWLTWNCGTWRYCYALFEAVCASLVAILIYTALARFQEPPRCRESLCRKCNGVLRGLVAPTCPACGERI